MSSVVKITKERYQNFLDFIKDNRNLKILDIGCQSGDMCHEIARTGNNAYGLDVVEELIVEARRKYPQGSFKCADCEKKIPFKNNFFDMVWAGDIIEHVHFTDSFINEINRILKIGGFFVLSTPMHNKIKNLLIALFCFEKHFDPEFPHLRFYTLNSLRKVLETRGFTINHVKYIGRIKPLAKSMFVVTQKQENKIAFSQYHY